MNNLMNRAPTLILSSPLHRLLSSRYLIIEFTGRRSGRTFRTPVAYARDGERIVLSTDSPWWHNFTEPAPVRLRLRGRTVPGTATAMSDPRDSAVAIRHLLDTIPGYARPAELARGDDGRVSDAEIDRGIAAGRVGIAIDLTTG